MFNSTARIALNIVRVVRSYIALTSDKEIPAVASYEFTRESNKLYVRVKEGEHVRRFYPVCTVTKRGETVGVDVMPHLQETLRRLGITEETAEQACRELWFAVEASAVVRPAEYLETA